MDLSKGKYLKHDILAFCGSWLVVYDGKYNYMLFNALVHENIRKYKSARLPANNTLSGNKYIEFYSNFNNAVDNLMRVVVNKGKFNPTFLKDVFSHL